MAALLYLTETELRALLEAAHARSPADRALLSTTYYLALRASEAAGLKLTDFDAGRGRVMVGVLKRFHRKRLPDGSWDPPTLPPPPRVACQLSSRVNQQLAEHVSTLRARGYSGQWLFPTRDSKRPPDRFDVLRVYHQAAKKIKLSGARLRHPHVLRHSRAMHHIDSIKRRAAEAGKIVSTLDMLSELRELLRHATDTVCLQYIRATDEVVEFSKQASQDLDDRIFGASNVKK